MSEDAFASPILDNVRGKQVSFARLRNDAYGTIENLVKQDRMRHIKALLDQCKLEGRERFEALADRYSPWVNDAQVAGYLQTRAGAETAVGISLREAGVSDDDAKKIIAAYLVPDLMNMALSLCGFTPRAGRDQNGILIARPADSNGDDAKGGKAELPADPTESQPSPTE